MSDFGAIGKTFCSLIKPMEGMEMLPWFTRIHGISQKDIIVWGEKLVCGKNGDAMRVIKK